MQFTYSSYISLLDLLSNNGYQFSTYDSYSLSSKTVIMRHDIDYSIDQSVRLARLEHDYGIHSTFFVLLSSDFYNPASSQSYQSLHEILKLGHSVGLHFDETAYSYETFPLEFYIRKEARILSDLLDVNINAFSLHRPNQRTIETQLKIPGLVNSYGEDFFQEFKYLSDSRRRWREPVEEIISSQKYSRLHILTHAFWYHEEEQSIKKTIQDFIFSAEKDRKSCLGENITGLDQILEEE